MKEKIKMRKIIAKIFTIHGYRNSPIEDLHAGIRLPKKYLDEKYSRITDEEMKHLNKTIYNQIYTLITMLEEGKLNSPFWAAWGQDWDEPELLDWVKEF
jgi:hypothetical protein